MKQTNVKVDKHAGEKTSAKAVTAQAKGNVNDSVKGSGVEEVGADHIQIMNDAANLKNEKAKEVAHDKHLNEVDKKVRDLDVKKIADTSELKQLKEDSEVVKAMTSLPADARTAEFSTVIGFYYKRMNENIKTLHEKLADKVKGEE